MTPEQLSLLQELERRAGDLNAWEEKFVASLREKFVDRELSPKQADSLTGAYDRVVLGKKGRPKGVGKKPEGAQYTTCEQHRKQIGALLGLIAEEVRPCQRCKRTIWMVRMKSGKLAPYTDDAVNHFADCPHAAEFRQRAVASGAGAT